MVSPESGAIDLGVRAIDESICFEIYKRKKAGLPPAFFPYCCWCFHQQRYGNDKP